MKFFKEYILPDKERRTFLLLAVFFTITQLILLKSLYPFADYIPDSDSYIEAAARNDSVSMWPIGYSKFLRLFGTIFRSDLSLVCCQYILIETSVLFFFFTILFFFKPGRKVRWALFLFCTINPLYLYLANFITSDALFLSGSLIWVSTLIWILHRPSLGLILAQAVTLVFLFTIRYNALYYPFLLGTALALAPIRLRQKIAVFIISCLLIIGFAQYTKSQFKIATGAQTFSPFSGWQLSNNALYVYQAQYKRNPVNVPSQFTTLDMMVRQFYDTIGHRPLHPDGSFFLWSLQSPLKQYLIVTTKPGTLTYFKAWSRMGTTYDNYGKFIIRHYPITFITQFVWPNVLRYFNPSREFLNTYNMSRDSVTKNEADWFKYPSQRVTVFSKTLQGSMLHFASGFNLGCNLLFVIFLGCYVGARRYKLVSKSFNKFLGIAFSLFVINFLFSIIASPIVLRYQVFPMTVYFFASLMLGDTLLKTDTPSSSILEGQARESQPARIEEV